MKKNIDLFKNFRKNIELLRIEKGLSTEEVAAKLRLSKKRVLDLEYGKYGRGTPKSEELFKIAKFFGVSVEDLVYKKAKVVLN